MKFKAQPKIVDAPMSVEAWGVPLDEQGYVTGFYVDGYIVGPVVESTEEYISLEWWCPVDVSTLKPIVEV